MNLSKLFTAILIYTFFVCMNAEAQEKISIQFKAGNQEVIQVKNWNQYDIKQFSDYKFGNNYYLLVQFNALPSEQEKRSLQSIGITLMDYIPTNTFTAIINENIKLTALTESKIRNILPLENRFKQDLDLISGNLPNRALVYGSNKLKLQLLLFNKLDILSPTILQQIEKLGGEISGIETNFNEIKLILPQTSLQSLLSLPWVLWVEPIGAQPITENLPSKNLHRSNVLNDGPRNLTGNNVRMGIWDGGVAGPHLDFLNRLIIRDNVASDDHHTHVAGTMLGAGHIDPYARGMAPKATMYSYDYNGSVSTEVATSLANDSIVISQNSWGYGNSFVNCTIKDPYNAESRSQDLNINNYPYFLHVHSSGNSQSVCSGGWGTTTGKAAKNTLVVANVSSADVINSSSSFGPTQDGRLKPEISGLGVSVYSTTPNNTYTGGYTGTSMATPGVSGTVAQLYERYRQLNSNNNPIASLLKSVVCNTAKDLGNAGPDYKHGFGRINGLLAARAIEDIRYQVNTIIGGQTLTKTITVPSGATKVKVMLAWTDPAAVANANPALVNDLDLVLRDPSNGLTLPWTLDPVNPANVATRVANHRDVMEQVTIDNPAAGTYTIEVTGFSVPTGPSQQYAITWEIEQPFIEVNYPNGGEVLVPGSSHTIYWNNAGVTSTQTVQYSTNNGTSWTTISSTVAATVNQLTWTVPSVATSQALIRVFSGAYTDNSDATFSIIGNSTLSFNPGCVPGEVTFNWTAVTNATSYDILKLDNTTATWLVYASNVTGTSYNATGLSTSTSTWFSIRARNNASSIVGGRSMAIEVSATASTPLTINATADSIGGCGPFSTTLRAITDANGYSVTSIPYATYNDAQTAITTWTNGTDDGYAAVTIPFSFKFYNQNHTSIYVSTNGFASFGSGSTVYTTQTLPSATVPNNLIALAWGDYNLTSGTIGTFVTGVAPKRKFVIAYNSVPPYSGTGLLTGQIVLHETTNIIDVITTTQSTTSAKTQGVENSSGSAASTTTGRNNVVWSSVGDAYRYTPTSTASFVWTPTTGLSSSTTQYPTLTGLTTTTTYSVTATSGTCIATDTVLITICPANVTLQLTNLLQGMHNSGTMPAYLYDMGLSTDPSACDSIEVELHSSSTPYALIASSNSIMNVNGISMHTFPGAIAGGSYYIVVKHRNSMETWSKLPVTLNSGITNTFNLKLP